jgi:hypothetical protein
MLRGVQRSTRWRIAAARGLFAASSGNITLPAGSHLSVSADDGLLQLRGDVVSLVGSLSGGAGWNDAGTLTWTGRRAGIDVTGTQITVGGLGPDAEGRLVTRGASLQATGEIRLTTSGPADATLLEINSASALRAMPAAADHLAVAAASSRIVLDASGPVRVYGLLESRGIGGDVGVRAGGRVLLDGLLRAADELLVDGRLAGGTSVELSQLLLKSDAQGRLLDSQDRLINTDGFLIDASGRYVDADGQPLADGVAPVLGGAPVRLSGGTLNAASVSITTAADLLLAGQIGELSASGGRLVSGTGSVSIRSGGVLDLRGRVQGEGNLDLRTSAALQLTTSGVVIGSQQHTSAGRQGKHHGLRCRPDPVDCQFRAGRGCDRPAAVRRRAAGAGGRFRGLVRQPIAGHPHSLDKPRGRSEYHGAKIRNPRCHGHHSRRSRRKFHTGSQPPTSAPI